MFKVIKNWAEIEALYDKATESQFDTKFSGMTYEDGIIAAIDWLCGRAEENPMEE